MLEKKEVAVLARTFLKSEMTGVLATASLDGQPYSSTVYFTADDDFSVYFLVSHHSKKFQTLTLNPSVSFTAGTGPDYKEITIQGTATQIMDVHERNEKLRAIALQTPSPVSDWPIFSIASLTEGGTALFKIEPSAVSYLDLSLADQADAASKFIYRLLP